MTEAQHESITRTNAAGVAIVELWRSMRAAMLHFEGPVYLALTAASFLGVALCITWRGFSLEMLVVVAAVLMGGVGCFFIALMSDDTRWKQLVRRFAELRRLCFGAFSESWFRTPVLTYVRPFPVAVCALAANIVAEWRWRSPFFADLISESGPTEFFTSVVVLVAVYVMMLSFALVLTLGVLDAFRWMWRGIVRPVWRDIATSAGSSNGESEQVAVWLFSVNFFGLTGGVSFSVWLLIWLTRWPWIAWPVGLVIFTCAVAAVLTSLRMDQSHGPLALVAISAGAWLVEFLILGDGLPTDVLSWAILMLNIVLAMFFVLRLIAHSHRSIRCAN